MSKGIENKAWAAARRELVKGSRTSPHEDSRTQRARSRQDAKRAAVKREQNDA